MLCERGGRYLKLSLTTSISHPHFFFVKGKNEMKVFIMFQMILNNFEKNLKKDL